MREKGEIMKKLRMFYATWCPHCHRAQKWIQELKEEEEIYDNLNLELIDYEKEPEKMEGTSFYYVPTFYLGDEKVFEGVPTKDIVKEVFDKALDS